MARVGDDEEELTPTAAASTVRLPRTRWSAIRRVAAEVSLISIGVFLGLMGQQWREHQQHDELATATLSRFRVEFQTNRDAIVAVKDRHVADLQALQRYLNSDSSARKNLAFTFGGTHPAFLQYAAWDVALATQSLSYLDPAIATSIAHVYAIQRQLDGATRDITQVLYSNAGNQNPQSYLSPFAIYFGDCTLLEPRLIAAYDEILPRLDRALGAASDKPSTK